MNPYLKQWLEQEEEVDGVMLTILMMKWEEFPRGFLWKTLDWEEKPITKLSRSHIRNILIENQNWMKVHPMYVLYFKERLDELNEKKKRNFL